MSQELFSTKEYGGITFTSTSHSLKAEKILLKNNIDLIVIPTPREISKSCGLTIKVFESDLDKCLEILYDNEVEVTETYIIKKQDKTNIIKVYSKI